MIVRKAKSVIFVESFCDYFKRLSKEVGAEEKGMAVFLILIGLIMSPIIVFLMFAERHNKNEELCKLEVLRLHDINWWLAQFVLPACAKAGFIFNAADVDPGGFEPEQGLYFKFLLPGITMEERRIIMGKVYKELADYFNCRTMELQYLLRVENECLCVYDKPTYRMLENVREVRRQ